MTDQQLITWAFVAGGAGALVCLAVVLWTEVVYWRETRRHSHT